MGEAWILRQGQDFEDDYDIDESMRKLFGHDYIKRKKIILIVEDKEE